MNRAAISPRDSHGSGSPTGRIGSGRKFYRNLIFCLLENFFPLVVGRMRSLIRSLDNETRIFELFKI